MSLRVVINGEEGRCVDVDDRGLAYGDGLFETIAVRQGEPLLCDAHLHRLLDGCRRLSWRRIPDASALRGEIGSLAQGHARAVVKVIVTRGSAGRGYRPGEGEPTRIVSAWSWPEYVDKYRDEGIAMCTCRQRLSRSSRLAGLKHLNRLEQVLARDEWVDEYQEGLMSDEDGDVIEGTMSNLFMVRDSCLLTPPLHQNGVAGVMRDAVIACAPGLNLRVEEQRMGRADLAGADELFITNSIIGVWPVRALDGAAYRPGPVARTILEELMRRNSIAYL